MKKFRDILETVYPPKPGDEKNFADKHIVDKKDYPNAAPGQFTSDKKKAKRVADYDEGDDEKVYEAAELHTKRADKEAVVVRAVDPKTGQSKARVVNRGAGEIKIGEETNLDEKAVNPYAVGMAAAMKQADDEPPLKKSTIVKGHEIAKSIKKEAMDPVGKHDADIDNDGDTDKSDKYLIKRRKAISRAVNEAAEVSQMRHIRSHGKPARDSGQGSSTWMFTHKDKGDVDYNDEKEVHSTRGKFSDAKKSAQKWAKEHGHSTVYVMESVELDEISKKTLGSYIKKAASDIGYAAAADDTNKELKRHKGIAKAANKLTKEEVELDEAEKPTYHYYATKNGIGAKEMKLTHTKSKPFTSETDALKHIVKTGGRQDGIIHTVNSATGKIVQHRGVDGGQKGYPTPASDMASDAPKHVRDLKEEVEQIDEISDEKKKEYIRAVADKGGILRKPRPGSLKGFDRKKDDALVKAFKGGSMQDYANLHKKSEKRAGIALNALNSLKKEEVDQIDEAFKVGAMHLEDGSFITLTREDVDMLNGLFKQLNSSNKTKMEQRLKSSKNGFNEIITFAKEVV